MIPHDLDAERAVLGACLVSDRALSLVISELEPVDFYSENHRLIFSAIRKAARDNEKIDEVVVAAYLPGDAGAVRAELFRLVESMPASSNATRYARIIREAATARATLDVLDQGKEACLSEEYRGAAGKVLKDLETVVKRDTNGGAEGFITAFDSLAEELSESRRTEGVTGIRTGIPKLDNGLKGLNRGRYYVVAARPGMGKSLVCAQIGLNAARQGYRVLLQSPEMTKSDYLKRLACASAGVDWERVEGGLIGEPEEDLILKHAMQIAALPFFVDERGAQTVGDIRRNAMRHEPDLIIVDYLQRLTPDDLRASKYEQVTQLSSDVDRLKKDFGVPVVAAAQLSRAVEQRHDKHPMLSDLRESGGIEQDADAVVMLFRPHYYDDEAPEDVLEMHIEKNRHGRVFETIQYLQPGGFWVVGAKERGAA